MELRPHLYCLHSRFTCREVPLLVFRHVWFLVLCFSCSVCADCADGSGTGSCHCLVKCCRGGGFFPNSTVALVLRFFWSCLGISRLRLNSLAALMVLPFSSVCLSYASTVACGCWPCEFSLRPSLVVSACVCRSFLGRRSCVFFLSYCSAWGRLLLSLLLVLLRAFSCGACGFPQHVLPQVTLRGLRNLSGSSCLSCSCGGAMYVGFAVSLVRRFVFNLVPCSSSGACGFAQLTLPQVALRGFCLF